MSHHRAACTCDVPMLFLLLRTQLLRHNSSRDIKASVLFVKQRKGSQLLTQPPLQDGSGISTPPPDKIYENVTLSDVSADAAMLCERKFIVTPLNQEKCVQEICMESTSYITIQCIYFCLVKCLFDGARLMCMRGLIFHLGVKLPIHFILYSHLTFYEKFKRSRRYGLYAFNIRENDL